MSGVAIIRGLLANNAILLASIPASKIFPGVIPIGTTLPAISISQVSGGQRNTVSMIESTKLVTDRVQVTVYAKTYPFQKAYMSLVRSALPNTHGLVNSYVCDSILPDNEGPDFYDDTLVIYEQSQDFMVKFLR